MQVEWLYVVIHNTNSVFLLKPPPKQDGVVYRIPFVYIVETGRPMQDWIKEHDREIRLTHTQTSAVSEHDHNTWHQPLWNEIKFIDGDPHFFTRRVKGAIHIRLHSDNINRDGGIEIPEEEDPRETKQQESKDQRNSEERPRKICLSLSGTQTYLTQWRHRGNLHYRDTNQKN